MLLTLSSECTPAVFDLTDRKFGGREKQLKSMLRFIRWMRPNIYYIAKRNLAFIPD